MASLNHIFTIADVYVMWADNPRKFCLMLITVEPRLTDTPQQRTPTIQ